MTETPNPALLPAGLVDVLPPEAEAEAVMVETLMEVFARHGYERVKAPLIEFEDSLLAGSGAAVAEQTFRFMDPDSQRMLGLRADTTPQVARIAATRLAGAPRPLRLSYAGQCLRVRGTQLAPDRQVAQAGIELIGPDGPAADAEIVVVAAEALAAVGLNGVSFDLTMPTLAPALLDAAELRGEARAALAHALDRKDAAAVARYGGAFAAVLTDLLLAAGPADRALEVLTTRALPPGARLIADRLAQSAETMRLRAPGLKLTLDPVEFRGFRYHIGVCVTAYAPGRTRELGRGGRYESGEGEPATGLTLYPDVIARIASRRPARPRVFVPAREAGEAAAALRREGWATLADLAEGEMTETEARARALRCSHVLRDGHPVPLGAR